MAIFHMSVKTGKKGSAANHAQYIARQGRYGQEETESDLVKSRLLCEFGGEGRFKQLWKRFKSASVQFAACDLFDPTDVKALISVSHASTPFSTTAMSFRQTSLWPDQAESGPKKVTAAL